MDTDRMDTTVVWERRQSESNPVDRYGLGALLKRLEAAEAGHEGRLEGFTFLQRWPEMLRFTRQIEDDLLQFGARNEGAT